VIAVNQQVLLPSPTESRNLEGGRSSARQGGVQSVPFKIGGFVICENRYTQGSRGVDMYKVQTANVDDKFTGIHYIPSSPGVETCNPVCLNGKWHSLRKVATVDTWSVLVYFDGLNANSRISKKATDLLCTRSAELFAPVQRILTEIVQSQPSPVTRQTRYLVLSADNDLTWMEKYFDLPLPVLPNQDRPERIYPVRDLHAEQYQVLSILVYS
jgi:hypothetical protein